MSHYTVLVIHAETDDLSTLLEPFNENTDVPRYRERATEEDVLSAIKFYADPANQGFLTDYHLPASVLTSTDPADRARLLGCYQRGGPADGGHDTDGYFTWSTYNPDSKWDWYTVGGRWAGYFLPYPQHAGDPRLLTGQPGAFNNAPTPGRVDGGPKGLLDLTQMRQEAAAKAAETHARFRQAVTGTPPATRWDAYVSRVTETAETADPYTIQEARAAYAGQPRVQAFNTLGLYADLQDFDVSEQTFIARAAAGAVPGYATLHDGHWYEPGRMGWWGMSSETPSTLAGYHEHVNGLIDALPDDTYLTIVDCHI